MEKTKVFIPCELNESMWSIKDFDKKVIYVKEQEGYFHTVEQMKKIICDAVEEGFLNNVSTEKYIESLNIK